MRDLGYEDGRTIGINWEAWAGEPAEQREIAADVVARKVDIIVAYGTEAQSAARSVTSTIPIVIWSGIDPVEAGLVQSLARPGGNLTGVAHDTASMTAKRLELLRETFPLMSRVAIVSDDGASRKVQRRAAEATARVLGLEFASVEVHLASEMVPALDAAARRGADGLLVLGNTPTGSLVHILAFVAAHRIPGVFANEAYVANGGLMTLVEDDLPIARRVANYVVRIINGERPADMPMERPTEFNLVINLRAAREQGLTIPSAVMNRATRVIE